jgi:hypothetical protein
MSWLRNLLADIVKIVFLCSTHDITYIVVLQIFRKGERVVSREISSTLFIAGFGFPDGVVRGAGSAFS